MPAGPVNIARPAPVSAQAPAAPCRYATTDTATANAVNAWNLAHPMCPPLPVSSVGGMPAPITIQPQVAPDYTGVVIVAGLVGAGILGYFLLK